MTRLLTVAGCASAFALAASAALADPPVESSPVMPATVKAPPAAAASPKDKDSDIVCFKEEQTGTRLGARRVCMTRAQAAQRSQDAKQVLDDTRGRLASSPQ